ncbi:hypothetical protein EBZ39_09715 [bacterium]|nr:hypothetical protein [bacterium]
MAQSYVTDAGTLIIPGAYSTIKVESSNSGLATTGVLMLVGEADAGPRFDLEEDLQLNVFGPDQVAQVVSKYRSGSLVDAFRAAATPANDPNIVGSPSFIMLVKTNSSAKAKASMSKWDSSTYMDLADKGYGKLGNLIYFDVTAATSEVVPTTGLTTWIPPNASLDMTLRISGGAALGSGGKVTIASAALPPVVVSSLGALTGISATGGTERDVIANVSGKLTVTLTGGNSIRIDYDEDFDALAQVGDTLVIPANSAIKGAGNANAGAYVVTAATANSITATKLSNMTGNAGDPVVSPVAISSPGISVAADTDVRVFAPISISLAAANPKDGMGKSLEVIELVSTPPADLLSNCLYALSTTKVSWVSKSGAPKLLTSASEYSAKLSINRQSDNVQEEIIAGGEIALKLGYTGTTCSVVVSDSTMTITMVGGTGAANSPLTLSLKDYSTLADLANYLNSQSGMSCSVGNGVLGQLPPSALDDGTFDAATTHGAQACRLKVDAYKLFKKVSEESAIAQMQTAAGLLQAAASGLPKPSSTKYLAGGTKGGTSDADVLAALEALEKVRGNFLVPLFSRDASSDILEGLTESASSYTIDSINNACRTHVLKMSTLKRRRNRQAFLSKKDTFTNVKEAASNIASFRCSMTFQDVKNQASDGSIKQFAPWMGATVAAGMQAAGFYRAIVNKFANVSGVLQAAKDFSDQDDTAMETALISGLLPMKRSDTGGYVWVSDQTTYGKDSNFVFNSIQATYAADIIALTTATRMERLFVGQSVAEISATLAKSALETILSDFLRLKLIAASDDAPGGYKDIIVRISGTSMIVSLNVKLAGAIYFIPISFLVSQVQQTA